ncbi:MAG: rod shape-determining protein MreC [Patescibacteria group bacterium]|nr:rod shape-determining protein MreC [Patescibacteria group bacterium]
MNKDIIKKIQVNFFLLVVIVLLIFLNNSGYLNKTKNLIVLLISPVEKIFQTSSKNINDFFYTIESINNLKNQNIELKNENLRLGYEISELKEVQIENKILRKHFAFSENSCDDGICIEWKLADVIGRDPSNFGKYIFIDLGIKDGIQEGQSAVASGGLLIGKIVEAYENSSKIMLITDPSSSINSITQTSRANGIVTGSYATGLKLEMINQSDELMVDDLVITSGIEEKIPKGLIIGRIMNIEEFANQVFKSAEINVFIDFNRVEKVFIVRKYD